MTALEDLVRDAYAAAETCGPAIAPPLDDRPRRRRGPHLRHRFAVPVAAAATVGLITTGVFQLVRTEPEPGGLRTLSGPLATNELWIYLCAHSSMNPACRGRDTTPEDRAAIGRSLRDRPEVISVAYVSPEAEFAEFVRDMRSRGDEAVARGVRPGDLPPSFRVTVGDPRDVPGLRAALTGMPGVDTVIAEN